MTFLYNGTEYTYPASLASITLAQRIDYDVQYGRELTVKAQDIEAMQPGFDKDVEAYMFEVESAVKAFSFFTGIPLADVQEHIQIGQILAVYNASLVILLQQQKEKTYIVGEPIAWNGETWHIAPPELLPDSTITFNEFLTSKEIVRQLYSLGQGFWDALPYLCCIYFRKEGEAFTEDLVAQDGARYNLMLTLPMSIALEVGFFLSDTMTIYLTTFLFSQPASPAGG